MNGRPTPAPTPAQIRDLMPFAVLLGIELLDAGRELVRARLRWTPEHCTTGGLMHGGALMALADTCGGVCAFLNLPDGARAPRRSSPRPTSCGPCAAAR